MHSFLKPVIGPFILLVKVFAFSVCRYFCFVRTTVCEKILFLARLNESFVCTIVFPCGEFIAN